MSAASGSWNERKPPRCSVTASGCNVTTEGRTITFGAAAAEAKIQTHIRWVAYGRTAVDEPLTIITTQMSH